MADPVGSLLARAVAFGTHPPGEDELARRILDATVQEAASCGLRELTIDAVAHRAATTRMTVYRRFGRREQLIEAMAIRETQRFIAALGEAISGVDDVEAQGPEAFIAGLRFMHEHPFTRRAIEVEPEAIIELLEADNGLVFRMGSDFIAERLDVRGLEPAASGQVAETLARIFVSFLLLPHSVVPLDDENAARAYVERCIAPIVAARSGT